MAQRREREGDLPASMVGILRDAARRAIEAGTLRTAARDIGMSPTGLSRFLEGGTPYRGTARKLTTWYVRWTARQGGRLDDESASAALSLLVQDLPIAARSEAVHEILEVLRRRLSAAEVALPSWMQDGTAS